MLLHNLKHFPLCGWTRVGQWPQKATGGGVQVDSHLSLWARMGNTPRPGFAADFKPSPGTQEFPLIFSPSGFGFSLLIKPPWPARRFGIDCRALDRIRSPIFCCSSCYKGLRCFKTSSYLYRVCKRQNISCSASCYAGAKCFDDSFLFTAWRWLGIICNHRDESRAKWILEARKKERSSDYPYTNH